jgi:hypothetical protein
MKAEHQHQPLKKAAKLAAVKSRLLPHPKRADQPPFKLLAKQALKEPYKGLFYVRTAIVRSAFLEYAFP